MRRIGVLGGTFDPIHNGHLAIARGAHQELGLERVLVVPARNPWLKGEQAITPAAHRLRMIELAIAGDERLALSTVDLEREGPSYTVDTLADVRAALGPQVALYFILGADALADLPSWHEPQRVIALCHLAVAMRSGREGLALDALEARVPGIAGRTIPLNNELVAVSSSEIRGLIAQGRPIAGLVPAAVERYIAEHGLYRLG